jgi:hypothetical protein
MIGGDLEARIRRPLSARPEILEAYLFGSRARGDAQPHSDIDIAIFVSDMPTSPFGYEAELVTDLMTALGSERVDLVLLNRAGPLLYHRVLRDGTRLLSRDLRATTVREGQALSRYCDYRAQLDKIDSAAHARLVRGDLGT